MIFNFLNRDIEVNGDSIALVSPHGTLSYKELSIIIDYTAAVLSSKYNISSGMHIAILGNNNSDFIILITAIWRLNAIPVPLNIRLLDSDLQQLIEHSRSRYIFIHNECSDRLQETANSVNFPIENPVEMQEYKANNTDDNNSIALLMYTSGTTGTPKGVLLSYSNLIHSSETTINLVNQSSDDRWFASLPFYHIGGLQIICRALLKGSSIILPESLDTGHIIESFIKYKPTLTSFVTTTLKRLVDLEAKPNPEMRFVFIGGGPSNTELIKNAIDLGWNIIKVYGSTETSSMISAFKCMEFPEKLDSAGKPFDDTIIRIIDKSGRDLSPFLKGEILVSGKPVMKGYLENEQETINKFMDGFHCTGDIGYIDNDGYLYIDARRTDMIISGGENINPLEIENELLKYPEIKDVCVFPLTDPEWGQSAAAAIVLSSKSRLSEQEIKELLKKKIASYKIPKRYFFVESLPRNELGKIKREEIRKKFELS